MAKRIKVIARRFARWSVVPLLVLGMNPVAGCYGNGHGRTDNVDARQHANHGSGPSSSDNSNADNSNTDNSNADNSNTDNSNTDNSNTDNSNADNSNADSSGSQDADEPRVGTDFLISTQQDFDKYREADLAPGDRILLERGASFEGMLAPRGSGTEEHPIEIGAFGQGSKPLIANGGVLYELEPDYPVSAGVFLYNTEFVTVRDLEITNTDGTEQGNRVYGIFVLAEDTGKAHNSIHIESCYIHDINRIVGGKFRGGIHVDATSPNSDDCPRYHDLRIVGNRIEDVGGVGISNRGDRAWDDDDPGCLEPASEHDGNGNRPYAFTDVYVAGNIIENSGINGIIARDSDHALYEHNTVKNCGRAGGGHSIYGTNTWDLTFQYNEAYGNISNENGSGDRGGFNSDNYSRDTYIQYNYSHGNDWFCGIMKKENKTLYIHHNLSVNELQGAYFFGYDNKTSLNNLHIYNNTHYFAHGDREIFVQDRTPINTTLRNNIFYFGGTGSLGSHAEKGFNVEFDHNLYVNMRTKHSSEDNAVVGEPTFVSPGSVPSDVDMSRPDVLAGFRLSQGSVGIDDGTSITIPRLQTVKDLWGQAFPNGSPDVGAAEYHD